MTSKIYEGPWYQSCRPAYTTEQITNQIPQSLMRLHITYITN